MCPANPEREMPDQEKETVRPRRFECSECGQKFERADKCRYHEEQCKEAAKRKRAERYPVGETGNNAK